MQLKINGKASAHNWWDEKVAPTIKADLARVIMLTGNVNDIFPYQKHYISLPKLMAAKLTKFRYVIFYDKASGITFRDEILKENPDSDGQTMRDRFKKEYGFTPPPSESQPQNNNDPFAAFNSSAEETPTELPKDPDAVFQLITEAVKKGQKKESYLAVVLNYSESLIPKDDFKSVMAVAIQKFASLDSSVKSGNIVFMVENNANRISEVITNNNSNVSIIDIPRPNAAELQHHVGHAVAKYSIQYGKKLNQDTVTHLLGGLRCVDFEDICRWLRTANYPIQEDLIIDKKREIIELSSGGLLKIVQPTLGFDNIGGMHEIKKALQIQVEYLKQGSKLADKGWVLMGPPGTGKSLLGNAMAKQSRLPFVILQNILSKYVGDSEKNMKIVLDILEAMSPAIVFIDEAAESVGGNSELGNDSGTSSRIRAQLQNFMGDDKFKGKIFFLLATNYPNNLPPAFLREGRMDMRVPVLPPDEEARKLTFEVLCKTYNIQTQGVNFTEAAQSTEGWTGAEISELLFRAKKFANEQNPGTAVTQAHLQEAIEDFIIARDEESVKMMTALALKYCNSKRLLPKKIRDNWQEELTNAMNTINAKKGISFNNLN